MGLCPVVVATLLWVLLVDGEHFKYLLIFKQS